MTKIQTVMELADAEMAKVGQPRHNVELHTIIRSMREKHPTMALRAMQRALTAAGYTTKSGGVISTSYLIFVLGRKE